MVTSHTALKSRLFGTFYTSKHKLDTHLITKVKGLLMFVNIKRSRC